ncbi:GntR family transcriptional regulator [Sphingomonas sanguinis]|jgi:DNA-binding GntR family transcriptional regulator|uniref:GntR family transcriptional regulator n=1 Tax=Sphingomonas sanguinis TaxID=33051 RepID=A0A7Y7QU47_9SPHN|nr:GntR family transcriptional regulator [Sphingomonas sanguinis]NNG53017.1 GntR family transcriptional regulator [Sphingomonas sanguinis]NVP30698.1 GntR family transcriptional regulator [Sphingomonas sanguinis]
MATALSLDDAARMEARGRGEGAILVQTLADRIFTIVRERIIAGAIPADRAIRQDALAAELGVSKIPLREAMARLEQEGLLEGVANRGYMIAPLSAAQAEDIYGLRLKLEPEAAARAAVAADEQDRAKLIAAFDALDQAASSDLARVAICNRQFHMAMVRPLRRPLTIQLIRQLAILAERYVVAHLQPAGRDARAHLEHREQLDAFLARDATRLQALLDVHIRSTLMDLKGGFAPVA